jgi:hypothetical protein
MIDAKREHRLFYGLYLLVVVIAFLLSFRSFAPYLTSNLSSDHAIHILMAYHLKLPDDLYYWGQNRLGSVVPILGHLVLKVLPLSPIVAVSYVQYFLLLVGFFCFASLFRSTTAKILFALVWFLPLRSSVELLMIGQPYGAQYAFIGIAVVLVNQLIKKPAETSPIRKQVLLALATASLFLGLWISDFTIVTMLLLVLIALKYIYDRISINPSEPILKKIGLFYPDIINVTVVSVLGLLFIGYAKANASTKHNYAGSSNSPAEILEVISKLSASLLRTLTFQANNLFLSLHSILVALLLIYVSVVILTARRNKEKLTVSSWSLFFLVSAIASLILLVLSHWVYINDISLRYFVVVYVALWVAALLFVEGLPGAIARRAYILLLLIALTSSFSLPDGVFAIQKRQPKVQRLERLEQLERLGQAGFIGEYWSSYVLCSSNPAALNCTPHDPKGTTPCLPLGEQQKQIGRVRCSRCVPEVLASEKIYLVKEKWFDVFPKQVQQFGQCLIKAGDPIKRAGYTLALYKKR